MATKTKRKVSPQSIQDAFIKYLLTEGRTPPSVFAFAEELGMDEAEFYTFYSSFESVERAVWDELMKNTLKSLEEDPDYPDFSAREKLFSFFYTHLEVLKSKRSFVAMRWKQIAKSPKTPTSIKSYKEGFLKYAKQLITQAINNDEIKERAFISDQYYKALWYQLVFIVDFWIGDTSPDFEQSDAAVEKAVNLAFELLNESTIDRAIDFAKFIWQSR